MSKRVSESCMHERRYIFAHINVATAATEMKRSVIEVPGIDIA